MEQLVSQWTNFREILYLRTFKKYLQKIQVLLKYDKYNRYSTWRPICIYGNISLNSSRNEKCIRKNCRENKNPHFKFNHFFSKMCRLWDNVEKFDTAKQVTNGNKIRLMHFAWRITKATRTFRKCSRPTINFTEAIPLCDIISIYIRHTQQ